MKKSKISLGTAALLVIGCLLLTNCRKKEKTPAAEPDTEQASAADNTIAESASNDLISIGSQLSENSGTLTTFKTSSSSGLMFAGGCATITSNAAGTVVPTSYTVDFGAACTSILDGRTRSGKLFFDFSGSTNGAKWFRNPGFKMVVTSSNYVVDGNQVNIINKTVANTTPVGIGTGTNPGVNLTWTVAANLNIIKANNAGTISWTCNRNNELMNTNDPNCYKGQLQAIDWKKAIIKLNGNASGTNAKNESYTANATDLIKDFNCAPDAQRPHRHPFISGKVSYTPGARATRLIDYGSGAVYPNAPCDFNATVTINGQTFSITLP
jgi:hypothetical protein